MDYTFHEDLSDADIKRMVTNMPCGSTEPPSPTIDW
jgi:hypothetical protein